MDQVADYLVEGFWQDTGRSLRSYDVAPGGQITVNLSGLGARGQETARTALDSWTALSGITFVESTNAQITFDDDQSGAWASSRVSGSTILSTDININSGWSIYGDYYLQTFIHEIGHALGLGHTGNYNGTATYGSDARFANDSWQMSIMSYFSQSENSYTDASYSFLATAQLADIAAVHRLYGTPTNIETGDTTYGDNETTGRFGMDLAQASVAIVDNGGIDTINLGSRSHSQMLNLGEETYSNLNGKIGNFSIGRNTVIENAITGAGSDHILGNAADNRLDSGSGSDRIEANAGDDTLIGGAGADTLSGGTGADRFVYASLSDAGDTVSDFDVTAGDTLDIATLLTEIGYSDNAPLADGTISLMAEGKGSWLVISHDNTDTQLVFLAGVAADTDVASIVHTGTIAPPTTTSPDNVYIFTDAFTVNWTPALGLVLDTNGGTDTIDVSSVSSASTVDLSNGGVGNTGGKSLTIAESSDIENVVFGNEQDRGYGNAFGNLMLGNGGDDLLYGRAGDDTLDGGAGDDWLNGEDGNDRLHGGDGNNRLDSGDGADTITAGDGNDRIDGGTGDNMIDAGHGVNLIAASDGNDTIVSGSGDDRIRSGDGDDHIAAGAGSNSLAATGGNNTIITHEGDDTITVGDGNDHITSSGGRNWITASAGNDTIATGGQDDTIDAGSGDDRVQTGSGHDEISGGEGNDRIKAGKGRDVIDAGLDNDRVKGGGGNDTLFGNDGMDRLFGNRGKDILSGGEGADLLVGGRGADVFVFSSAADVGDTIRDFNPDQGDTLDIDHLLIELGSDVQTALNDGLLGLTERPNGTTWLEFDADGEGGNDGLLIAQLNRIGADEEIALDWFS